MNCNSINNSLYCSAKKNKLKCSFAGNTLFLWCNFANIPSNAILSDVPAFNNFKGAMAENHVAASLVANGREIFYWESNGKAELDFILQMRNGDIVPIEVKSGIHTKSKSLGVFLQRYNIPYAVRISSKNFGFENGIKSVPLYATFLI